MSAEETNAGPLVLVVDDEEDVRHAIRLELQAHGYRVLTAKNGRVALEMARAVTPDLVILDLMMPILDGYSTHQGLRSLLSREVPILFITATSLRIRSPDLKDVPHSTMQKPLDFDEMLARIRQLLEASRQ